MIPDFHMYHGAVLSVLSSERPYTAINKLPDSSQGEYQINHDLGLYIKHGTLSEDAWTFNFHPEHQETVRRMFNHYNERILIALVCVRDSQKCEIDGVCLLDFGEYASVLGRDCLNQKNLKVNRPTGGSYWISGPEGTYKKSIAQSRFPKTIIDTITQN